MQSTTRITDEENINVVVRHQDPVLRLGITAALRGVHHVLVKCEEEDIHSTHCREFGSHTTVVICDYEAGLELAKRWSGQRQLRIIVMTAKDKEADVQYALSQGVCGYLLLGSRVDEIVDAIKTVSRGARFLSHLAAQRVAGRCSYQELTAREGEVLTFVVVGWSNKMVANRLGVTEGTVKSHVKAIFEKLDVRTRTEAANVAMRRGLVALESASPAYAAVQSIEDRVEKTSPLANSWVTKRSHVEALQRMKTTSASIWSSVARTARGTEIARAEP